MASTQNSNPTAAQADALKLGIALAQTAYAPNNGGGVKVGDPLVFIDDQALVGVPQSGSPCPLASITAKFSSPSSGS
jgi:hypothetical protein